MRGKTKLKASVAGFEIDFIEADISILLCRHQASHREL